MKGTGRNAATWSLSGDERPLIRKMKTYENSTLVKCALSPTQNSVTQLLNTRVKVKGRKY